MRRRRRWRDRGPLGRWSAYRRWGPRPTWTGNNVHDLTIEDRGEGGNPRPRFWGEGWTTCRCGKEYHVSTAEETEQLVRMLLHLKGTLCRSCVAWVNRRSDRCPDGNCTLTYEHKGRCRPFVIPDEVRQRLTKTPGQASEGTEGGD